MPLALLPFLFATIAQVDAGPRLLLVSSTRTASDSAYLAPAKGAALKDGRTRENPALANWTTDVVASVSSKEGNGAGVTHIDSRYGRGLVSLFTNADANCFRQEPSTAAGGHATYEQVTRFKVDRVSNWKLDVALVANAGALASAGGEVRLTQGAFELFSRTEPGEDSASFKLRPFAVYELRVRVAASATLLGDLGEETFSASNASADVRLASALLP